MKLKFIKAALVGLVLSVSGFANAELITVNYEVSTPALWGTGSFEGEDTNLDGFLSFDELTTFSGSDNVEGQIVDLSTLFDVGDFDILENVWLANAAGWEVGIDDAWFTWNDRGNSVNSRWATVSTVVESTSVPVPSTLAIFALGVLGLVARKFKK